MFGPCSMRASADQAAGGKYKEDSRGEPPLQRSEPWCCSDLDGIEDGLVRSVYRIAKCTYSKVEDPSVHLSLNSLVTTIAEQEPTSCDYCKLEMGLLRDWNRVLVTCDEQLIEPDVLATLGPAQTLFEDSMKYVGKQAYEHLGTTG
jgi:hypothetical protein